jgi:hypothetical protein
MRRALLLLVVVVCLAGVGATMAQDPVKVDPKHYKVEFENDQVRVLRVHLGPKESIPLHEHPQCVLTFLTDLTSNPPSQMVRRRSARLRLVQSATAQP